MKKSKLFKRILAYTLVLSVIFSQLVFSFNVSAAEKIAVWDGTKAETFAGGNGSVASPYLIETAEQLYKMVVEHHTFETSNGKYFKITKDIYLNDVADGASITELWGKKNWLAGYGDTIAAASKANSFNGTLDGSGHTIYGLYADGSAVDKSSVGLFPAIASYATVKNLNFDNILVTGGSGYGGAIAGQAIYYAWQSSAKITNCSVTNSTIGQWKTLEMAGGLLGDIRECSVTFTDCYSYNLSLSNWDASGIPGGIVGSAYANGTLTISNCYSAGNFITNSKVSKAVCTNVYTDVAIPEGNTTANVTVLSTEQMKGEAAKTNMAGLDFVWIWKTVENDYPVTRENPVYVWDGKTVTGLDQFAGDGSPANPYQIENASQLAYVVSTDLTDGLHFKLVKDIRINDTTKENWKESAQNWVWKGIRFTGTFDGDGHTIDGLCYKGSSDKFGLFSYVGANDAGTIPTVIKNIKMTNAYIACDSKNGVAILAGQTSAKTTFEGIYIDETCSLSATKAKGVAGIVGFGNGKTPVIIKDSAVLATIAGDTQIGAFAGAFWSNDKVTIVDSFSAVANAKLSYKALLNSSGNYGLVSDDYGTTVLTADQMKGEAAKTNMSGLDFDLIWQTVENGYPVIRENALFAWDGTAAANFAGGTGTAEDPFLIENGGQLYKMVADYSNVSIASKPETQTYFKLTKDINLGGKQWYNTGLRKYPSGSNYAQGFSGIIYGNYHTVYGLYNGVKVSVAGLIPVATQGTEIYDLHLEGGNLPKADWDSYAAGGLIGLAVGAKYSTPIIIDGCSVKDYTVASRDASAAFVGYVYSQSVTIKNCFAKDNNLSHTGSAAGANSGAFIGSADGNDEGNDIIIETSYSVDEAALIGFKEKMDRITTFNDVYTANEAYDNSVAGLTKLTAAQMTGAAAIDNMAGFNFNQIWQVGAEGEYPTLKTADVKALYWNNTAAEAFAGGNGTLEDPYKISNAEQLYLLANSDTTNTAGKYYILTNDIEISDVHDGWENENPYSWTKKTAYLDGFGYSNSFAGTLNGNGYTVRGLYYSDEITNNGTYAYGLIPFVSANAVIKNINVEYVAGNVTGSAYTGAVAGAAHVTKEDIVNPLNMVQFVGVNVSNSNLAVLGGASRGVKFELCNAETLIGVESENISVRNCNTTSKYTDDVLIFNNENKDSETLTYIINYILGDTSRYITDINGDANFNLLDLVSIKKAFATLPSDEYQMVWSQEFDGDAVDYSVLTNTESMSQGSTLEFTDSAVVNDGNLKLSCSDTGRTDANGDKIYNVNYGLTTANTMSFKYGKLEMRAKIPFGAGAFPSLWLTSRDAIGYDKYSEFSTEVDIFEVFAKKGASEALVTCIHKWYNDENGVKTGAECSNGSVEENNAYRTYKINSAAQNEFHTFTFEWKEDSMSFAVDGTVYYTATRDDMKNFDIDGYTTNSDGIFNQPLCIIINNHMYTTGKGAAYTYTGQTEIDPSLINYEIDYIRLYQKNDGKSEITFR